MLDTLDAAPKPSRRKRADEGSDTGAASAPTSADVLQLARRTHLKREIGGIALLLAAVFIAGSLLAGGASDGQSCSDAATIFGPVGACLRSSILLTLGALCAVIVPFIPAVHALRLLGRIEESDDTRWLFFTIGLAAIVPVAAALARGATVDASNVDPYAGLVGSFVAFYLVKAIGLGGAWVGVAILSCALMAGTLAWNPLRLVIGGGKKGVRADAADAAGAAGAAVVAASGAGDGCAAAFCCSISERRKSSCACCIPRSGIPPLVFATVSASLPLNASGWPTKNLPTFAIC